MKRLFLFYVFLFLLTGGLSAETLSYFDGQVTFDLPDEVNVVSGNREDCLFEAVCGDCKVYVRHYEAEIINAKKVLKEGDYFLFPNLRNITETFREKESAKRPDKAKVCRARYTDSRGEVPVYYETFTFLKSNRMVCILVMSPDGEFSSARAVVDAFHFGPVDLKGVAKRAFWGGLEGVTPILFLILLVVLLYLGDLFYRRVVNKGGWKDIVAWLALAAYFALTVGMLLYVVRDGALFWTILCFSVIWFLLCFCTVIIPGMRRVRRSIRDYVYKILNNAAK